MSAMKSTVLVFLTTVSMVLSSLVPHYVRTLVLSETGLQNERVRQQGMFPGAKIYLLGKSFQSFH